MSWKWSMLEKTAWKIKTLYIKLVIQNYTRTIRLPSGFYIIC